MSIRFIKRRCPTDSSLTSMIAELALYLFPNSMTFRPLIEFRMPKKFGQKIFKMPCSAGVKFRRMSQSFTVKLFYLCMHMTVLISPVDISTVRADSKMIPLVSPRPIRRAIHMAVRRAIHLRQSYLAIIGDPIRCPIRTRQCVVVL